MGELLEYFGEEQNEVRVFIGKASFRVDDKIYHVELMKETETVPSEDEDQYWELTLEMKPEKKVQINPNNLPWIFDRRVEIRTNGFTEEDLITFIDVFDRFLEQGSHGFPDWFSEVVNALDFSLYGILPRNPAVASVNEE